MLNTSCTLKIKIYLIYFVIVFSWNLKAMYTMYIKDANLFFNLKYINSFIHYYAKQELNEEN